MVKLCLMASHGCLPGSELLLQQEYHRVFKDCQPYLPNMVAGQEIIRPVSLRLKPHQSMMNGIELGNNHFRRMDSTLGEPLLINVTDEWPNRVLSSSGMSEQCTKHDRIMQFSKSRRNELEAGGLDLSEVSELMDLQSLQLSVDLDSCTPRMNTKGNFDFVNPLVDFLGDMARSSKITIQPDGRVVLTGSGTEIKDIIPIVAEFYLNNTSTSRRRQSALIPQFNWLNTYETEISSSKVQNVDSSPQKVKGKPSLKRRSSSKRGNKERRDLYTKNYSHACESLLSLMMNKRHSGKTAVLSLKKSAPELRELLTQFSAGIAGTGIAVLFSVVYKVVCGPVRPLCTSKLLSTGLGVGLVWLSWAVNELRDTIVRASRNAGKGLKDEEVVTTVNRSLKDVYFRAATLLAVAVLRVA